MLVVFYPYYLSLSWYNTLCTQLLDKTLWGRHLLQRCSGIPHFLKPVLATKSWACFRWGSQWGQGGLHICPIKGTLPPPLQGKSGLWWHKQKFIERSVWQNQGSGKKLVAQFVDSFISIFWDIQISSMQNQKVLLARGSCLPMKWTMGL